MSEATLTLFEAPAEPEIDLAAPWGEAAHFQMLAADETIVRVRYSPEQLAGVDVFFYHGPSVSACGLVILKLPISQRHTYANPEACAGVLLLDYHKLVAERDAWRESLRGRELIHTRWANKNWLPVGAVPSTYEEQAIDDQPEFDPSVYLP